MNRFWNKKAAVAAVSAVLLAGTFPQAAMAGIIDTQTVVSVASRADSLSRIDRALSEERIAKQMTEMGVERSAVDSRMASLTDVELASLADRLETAPAGGDILGLIGAVFVVLLILELVGVIDIFKSVGPARR